MRPLAARELMHLAQGEQPVRVCPMTYPEYVRYLRSGHWQRFRKRIRAQREERCENCRERRTPGGKLRLEVHHLTYARMGAERDSDVKLLCQACHADAHQHWDPFE